MKLNVKLTVVVFIMAVFCSCIIAFASFSSIKKTTIADHNKALASLIKTVNNTASTAAFVSNEELAKEVILGLEENEVVYCVEILTDTMTVRSKQRCYGDNPIVSQLLSPFDQNEIVGKINLYANQDFITTKSRKTFIDQAINILIIIAITTSIILIATYLLLTQPLTQLAQNLRGIDLTKETDERIKESSRTDEIGIIATVINRLLDDASSRIKKEQDLTKQTQLLTDNLKMVFDLSKNSIAVTDEELNLISYNPEFNQFLQGAKTQIEKNKTWTNNIFGKRKDLQTKILESKKINVPDTFETEINHKVGNEVIPSWFNVTYVKTQVESESNTPEKHLESNILFFIDDITEHKLKLEQSEHAADHDNLTKLLNRRSASRMIRHKLQDKNGGKFALMMLDLDGFKPINDNHGHETGDHILRIIASRLEKSTRKSDIVARWGGDEFLIVINNVAESDAEHIANKILSDMLEPILYNNKETKEEVQLNVGSSIGIAMGGTSKIDLSTLIDHADKAMYDVKKSGKNGVKVYKDNIKEG